MAKPRANNIRGSSRSKPNVKANMLITKPTTHSGKNKGRKRNRFEDKKRQHIP
nr:hypothetical protein [Tanacetum cinerariifolium]